MNLYRIDGKYVVAENVPAALEALGQADFYGTVMDWDEGWYDSKKAEWVRNRYHKKTDAHTIEKIADEPKVLIASEIEEQYVEAHGALMTIIDWKTTKQHQACEVIIGSKEPTDDD